MANIDRTRLRFMTAPNAETLQAIVDKLPFKIEIKSVNKESDNRWTLWFVLPEIGTVDFKSGEFK